MTAYNGSRVSSLNKVEHYLCELAKYSYNIYTHGEAKVKYLKHIIGRCVVSFKDYKAPSFYKLKYCYSRNS